MRRAYQTDLSNAQWAYIEAHLPSSKPEAGLGYTPCARSSTPSSTSFGVAVLASTAARFAALEGAPPLLQDSWRLDTTWEKLHAPPYASG